MQGYDARIHLAGSFELWVPDKRVYRAVNVEGVRNVMESALETGIQKVVHISPAAVYGDTPAPVTEESPFGSYRSSAYAQTKFEGDVVAWQMYEERGLPLVMIDPTAVIGPHDPKACGRYIRNFALGRMPAQVMVDSTFPFVAVSDVCEAITRALLKEGNIGEKYLVSACNMTWGEMNALIAETVGTRLPRLRVPNGMAMFNAYLLTGIANLIKKPPPMDLSVDQVRLMRQSVEVDGTKAERELGLTYTSIREAVAEAVAGYRAA